ncbi:uncharacterized protein [Zea mays]|uniref:Protein XRI1 n=1 Tax=Zea mays TaxID=4577 RepID=A0A804QB19_MAIZE|nr:uncharacterized protein LOC100272692 isoform X1 [Zea mays]|eukprot:XP_023156235.1 uncharacterized protein LOC100272692 isoform X1 [Zea mays]
MEREVQLMEGRQAWPLHMMGMAAAGTTATCFDNYSSSGSGGGGGDCFVLGWEQLAPAPFGCFGLLTADVHDLFPLFATGMEPALPALPPSAHDVAAAIPGELDDLLLSFWDASCHDGDVGEPLKAQQQAAFNSSCCVTHERGEDYCTPTTDSFVHYDDNDDGDDPLSSIFSAGLAPAAEGAVCPAAAEAEPLPSSSSSNCRGGDPRAGGVDLQPQGQMQQGTARARGRAGTPPLPRTSAPSLKRATREAESSSEHAAAAAAEECSQSGGGSKRRKGAGVVRPFALLKPDGLDGGATLADINARILMRPARPVRHPVGEFACAPRVSADQPGFSGKAVASLTRLHTPGGRGTITIIRTRG